MSVFPLVALAIAISAAEQFQGPPISDEPILRDGQLVFPEGAHIPKSMTQTELDFLDGQIIQTPRGVTPPPVGPIRGASEYEDMAGILLAWEGYSSIVAEMAAAITTVGNAKVFIACDSNSEANTARNSCISAGANSANVITVVRTTNTVWIRDYGPRYVYEGDCRVIVDHTYNRPRPNDNAYSSYFGPQFGHEVYEIPLVHGGGNYHLNGIGTSAATELIMNENPGLSESQIVQYWRDYQNVDTYIHDAFPTSVDYTQHIDMWMLMCGDDRIIISDWPTQSGSTQDQICDWAAGYYQGLGWDVFRVPAFSQGGTHYTYANMVVCNGVVLLPKYNDISDTYDNQAVAAVQAAMPDREVVQITCDSLAYSAGVMHCICMHMPAHAGGIYPTTCLQTPVEGIIDPDDCPNISWISDDDEFDVTSVDIQYSTNDGATWTTLQAGLSPAGSTTVCIPDTPTTQGRLQVLARDGDGNTGGQISGTIIIEGDALEGDVDGDGDVDVVDVLAVIADWDCVDDCAGDVNGDSIVNVEDILVVLANFGL
ncbi:MAG: agmatine deiminase family protein [Phycisphaerales bacterium]|nr:agmatine deiminase family protein [Phycisphaerales bacterium]